ILAYGHGFETNEVGCAITAGAFYDPALLQFPQQYSGSYFYADFCQGWIRTFNPNSGSELFAEFTYFPVDLKVAKNGTLYYLERGLDSSNTEGAVFKIEFTSQNSPVITQQPANVTVAAGQPASFSVQASGSAPLSYRWQRNGVNLDGPTSDTPTLTIASAQLADNGASYACVVSNQFGNVTSQAAQLTVVKGSAPVASITLPVAGTQYRGGDVIQYSGTGTDADAGHRPASAFMWQVDFHHDTHTHR